MPTLGLRARDASLRAVDVCTIIAKNYLAHARVLARSFARHHPDGRFWTLIIDDFDGYVDPANEPFEVLTPAEIGCEPFIHMAMRYSVLELSTAVKPWLLRHLMGETGRPVTYLDPDIKIYGSLKPLDDLAAAHGVVLIPHNNEPIPPDDRMPSQVDIMIAGIYNLGYVSLAPGREVEDLLDWWADRLERDCRVDPKWGYFVDQRWFDLTPGFLSDVAIVRDPEFNLAYWNLHSRRLGWADGRYTVNGRPLTFFHFSGFDPQHPLVLSRHQNRVDVTDDPVLEQLLGEYAGDVMGEGHAVSRNWPYSYGARRRHARSMTRCALCTTTSPMSTTDASHRRSRSRAATRFRAWLSQTAPGWPPRHQSRACPRLRGPAPTFAGRIPTDRSATSTDCCAGLARHGQREVPLLARGASARTGRARRHRAARPDTRAASRPRRCETIRGGSIWSGYSRSSPARRRGAPGRSSALDATGTDVLPIETLGSDAAGQAAFPLNVLCIDADLVPEFVREVGEEFVAGRYSSACGSGMRVRRPKRWRRVVLRCSTSCGRRARMWHGLLEAVATVPVHTVRMPAQPRTNRRRARGRTSACPTISSCSVVELRRPDADSSAPIPWRDRSVPASVRAGGRCHGCCCGAGIRRTIGDPRTARSRRRAEHPDIDLIDG